MMRAIRWQKVTPTFGYDVKGSWRSGDKREARRLIQEAEEEIQDGEELRRCWNFHYSLYPAAFADHVLDLYGIPKPPSRSHGIPE